MKTPARTKVSGFVARAYTGSGGYHEQGLDGARDLLGDQLLDVVFGSLALGVVGGLRAGECRTYIALKVGEGGSHWGI